MPKSVKKAFVKIFDEKLGAAPSPVAAEGDEAAKGVGEKLWDNMEAQKRLVEETWG